MALHKSELMMQELNDFLDTLPKTPCDESPTSRYFCTVCERLNRSVQKRCSVYKSRMDEVGLSADRPDDIFGLEGDEKESSDEKGVEFKIVEDRELDDDMPLFEVVKPSGEDTEPLEMDLLEDEALEFDLLNDGDEEISPDALEVEPIDGDDEEFEGLEVEPLEVDEIEEEEQIPSPQPAAVRAPKPRPKPVAAKPRPVPTSAGAAPSPKVKAKKKAVARKPAAAAGTPRPQVRKAAASPKVVAGGRPRPVRKKPVAASPRAASGDQWKQVPPESSTVDIIADIEKQLVIGQPCTQCGVKLSNSNFCTQCGAKVEITPDGIRTVPR
jgi:hypothetical protein